MAVALAVAGLSVSAAGCAKEETPPGALPDQRPPGVREIVPTPGSVVTDFDGTLRVRFDEPIQQPGSGYGRQLEASPADRYRVTSSFTEIRVRPEGDWRQGAVYVFRLPGGIRDLLGNEREESIDVVFSTGPEVTQTRVSGRIRSGMTGRGVRDARVLFLSEEGDSIPYGAVSDTGGVFSLRSLPPGRYKAYGFEDLNANRSPDRRLEPHDSAAVHLEDGSASVEVSFRMIPPDSTPPVLARAEAVDSFTVLLTFDDPLDPGQDFAAAEVSVRPSGQGEGLPVERIGLGRPPSPEPEEAPAGADTLPAEGLPDDTLPSDDLRAGAPVADTLPADSVPPEPDEARPGPARPPAAADTLPLPSDSLYLRLGRPLEEDRTYRASASGLVNLRGLAGGGDTTFVYAPPDTAGAPGVEAPPDTAGEGDGIPEDTADGGEGVPPDTAAEGPPPDTAATGSPPDTDAEGPPP